MSQFKDDNKTGRYILWGALAVLAIIVFFSSFYTIRSTERGVLATFGRMSDTVVEDGLHLKIPFIQTIKRVNVQQKKHDGKENSYTRDVQTSVVEYTINYELVRENVSKLMKNVGEDYHNRIVVPFIRSAMKEAFGNFAATEIVENRDAVRREIENTLRRTLDSNYFMNIQFQLVDIDFDDDFETAIKEKQVAEQNALKAKNVTIQVEEQAKQTKIKAEADEDRSRNRDSRTEAGHPFHEVAESPSDDQKQDTLVSRDRREHRLDFVHRAGFQRDIISKQCRDDDQYDRPQRVECPFQRRRCDIGAGASE